MFDRLYVCVRRWDVKHTYVGLYVLKYTEQAVSWTSEGMVGEFKAKGKVGWVHTMKAHGEVEI